MKWIKAARGIRYREHPTRKNGLKPDRYYSIFFKIDGKQIEQGIGWGSEGITIERAEMLLFEFKNNAKTGGVKTLKEKRQIQSDEEAEKKRQQELFEIENVSFKTFFIEKYLPVQKTHKSPSVWSKEEQHAQNWLFPVIGDIPIKNVCAFHIERIKKNMLDVGRSPRTVQYCLATFRQTWNMARREGIVITDSPSKNVKLPRFDNQRQRYLTPEECILLLEELRKRSHSVYCMSLLALDTGLRFSEIAGLQWQDIDLVKDAILLRDTKSGRNRTVYMTNRVKAMFREFPEHKSDDLVLPDRNGKRAVHISKTFDETVAELGLNDDISDVRLKAVFHSLRHTHASRLLEAGVDIYRVKELLGHSHVTTTERYSHVTADRLRSAIADMERMHRGNAEVLPLRKRYDK